MSFVSTDKLKANRSLSNQRVYRLSNENCQLKSHEVFVLTEIEWDLTGRWNEAAPSLIWCHLSFSLHGWESITSMAQIEDKNDLWDTTLTWMMRLWHGQKSIYLTCQRETSFNLKPTADMNIPLSLHPMVCSTFSVPTEQKHPSHTESE